MWPFAVMGTAFLLLGLSEYFRKRYFEVIGRPLYHCATVLPLLPLLAFWLRQSQTGSIRLADVLFKQQRL